MKNRIISFSKKFRIVILLLALYFCFACTCENYNSLREEFDSGELVIIGKILQNKIYNYYRDTSSARTVFNSNKELKQLYKNNATAYISTNYTAVYLREYSVKIERKFKGIVLNDTITIRSGAGDHDCGARFVVGNSYLIFASTKKWYIDKDIMSPNIENTRDVFMTSLCNYNENVD